MNRFFSLTISWSFIITIIICSLPSTILAAVGTNPSSGNANDYSGVGDWLGTVSDDQYSNNAGATVDGSVDMTQGGSDTVDNDGTVDGHIMGASTDNNLIDNSGSVVNSIHGSYNQGANSSGSSSNIINSGTVGEFLYGSYNLGPNSIGGSNTITNSGYVDQWILGSLNRGTGSSGGDNTITNSGQAVSIFGSSNEVDDTSGGSNTITNHGAIISMVYGSYNQGNSNGGSNTITNFGTIGRDIYGSYNIGTNSSGGNNTILNSGIVQGYIFGSDNNATGSSGGDNTIINSGTVDSDIYGSANIIGNTSGGGNTIINSGTVVSDIEGSYNFGTNSSGGSNTIINSGTVDHDILGSNNLGAGSSGGSNVITNSQTAGHSVYGSYNHMSNNSGGSNTITNSGYVNEFVYGSYNKGDDSTGGSNAITNRGIVDDWIFGSLNEGDNSIGGSNIIVNIGTSDYIYGSYNLGDGSTSTGNTITNSGTVTSDIFGSTNLGAGSSGGDDIITNSGTVGGSIYASDGNDTVTNSGTVGGSIYASDGNDTVTMQNGPENIGGNIDGGADTDTIVYSGGTWTQNHARVINFEYYEIDTTANLTLDGVWDIGTKTAQVSGGALYIPNSLDAQALAVNSGEANINGTITAPTVTVASAGLLSGAGSINGDVNNSGTISPGNSIGTLTVNGDVTFNSGSTYEVEISGNSSDKLVVNGVVNINGGKAKAHIPRKLYTGKEKWSIITATDGVNGRFDGLSNTPRSATLNFGLGYSATTVGLYVTRTPYQTFGATANDQAVGGTLDTIVPLAAGSGDNMEQFLIELDFDYTADQISEALAALNPEMYSSFMDMEFLASQEFAKDITTRMHQLRESNLHLNGSTNMQGVQNIAEESSGKVEQIRASRGWNLWAQTSGSVAENGETESSGYDIRSGRITVGGDKQFNDWLLVGAAMGINQSDLDYNLGNASGDQQGMHAAVYGDARYRGFYLNSILSYGDFSNDSERVMNVFGTTAEASFDGSTLSAQLGTGYDFTFSNWQVGPALEIGVAQVDVDSFRESGNRSALNLNIEEQSDNHLYERLGIKAASVYQLGSTTLLPRLGLGWQHTSSDDASVDAYFSGYQDAMFTVVGANSPQDVFGGELGLTALVGDQLSLYGKISTAFGDDYINYGLSMGLDWKF